MCSQYGKLGPHIVITAHFRACSPLQPAGTRTVSLHPSDSAHVKHGLLQGKSVAVSPRPADSKDAAEEGLPGLEFLMLRYETELKKPIRSIMSGQLARALLIQASSTLLLWPAVIAIVHACSPGRQTCISVSLQMRRVVSCIGLPGSACVLLPVWWSSRPLLASVHARCSGRPCCTSVSLLCA